MQAFVFGQNQLIYRLSHRLFEELQPVLHIFADSVEIRDKGAALFTCIHGSDHQIGEADLSDILKQSAEVGLDLLWILHFRNDFKQLIRGEEVKPWEFLLFSVQIIAELFVDLLEDCVQADDLLHVLS